MPPTPISRRRAVTAAIAGSTLLATVPAQAQPASRRTYILIHGAYHGGWCWQRVTAILEAHGHKVYAPSLTGNGDRIHLLTKDLTLETQIADITNLVEYEDLTGIHLVVHSYGGWAGSGALERIHGRVAEIVWLDAFMPRDGEKPVDYISDFSRKAMIEAVARGEAGRTPPPPSTYSIDTASYPWIQSKLTPQSNSVALLPIHLTGKLQTITRKTFIRAPRYQQAAFDRALAECRADPSWTTHVNENTGHDVMIDQPKWLAEILLRPA